MPISAASSGLSASVKRHRRWSSNAPFSNVGLAVLDDKAGGFNAAGPVGVAPMGTIGTCFGIESKGNKVMYFSPSFGGLTFGVSFTPTGGQRRAGGGLSSGNNALSAGCDYTPDFGGWNLTAGGGGEWALTQYTPAGGNTNNKASWYQAG